MAKQGLHPRFHSKVDIPTFEEIAQQVHIERLPIWKNAKHGQQWINMLRDYAFRKIGRMPVNTIGQPEVLMCLSAIWAEKHETARRLAKRTKTALDVAQSKGFRDEENPVVTIRDGKVLPQVKAKPKDHKAMDWREVPAFFNELRDLKSMSANALIFTCLTGSRTGEVLGMRWEEVDFKADLWTCPAGRMKTGEDHRVPSTKVMSELIEPLRALCSEHVFEGQKRHRPLSNMAMLMLLRRMKIEGATGHGFRSTFRDWAAEAANAPREIAEMSLSHRNGSKVEQAYARSDLLEKRRHLMERWSLIVTGGSGDVVSPFPQLPKIETK